MPRALFDTQRIVAAHRHPRDPRRAKIVKRDVLSVRVVGEEIGSRDERGREVLTKHHCSLVRVRQPEARLRAHAFDQLLAGLARDFVRRSGERDRVKRLQERTQRRLDRNASRVATLGGFHFAGLAIDRFVDVDHAVLEIDVAPRQRFELAGARVSVDGDGVEHAERDIDRAFDQ